LQAIGKYRVGMEAPTPYELSETFLQKEMEETERILRDLMRVVQLVDVHS